MDVDILFPNLSSLVQSKENKTLCQYGAGGKPENDDYWNLKSSCWSVIADKRKRDRFGPHQALKTLDEYLRLLPANTPTNSRERERIAVKICSSSQGDEFLNKVVEVVWKLFFLRNHVNIEPDKPLDEKKPKGNDADIVVVLDGVKYWLEATSVILSTNKFPVRTSKPPLNELLSVPSNSYKEDVLAELAYRAKLKYQNKFGKGTGRQKTG